MSKKSNHVVLVTFGLSRLYCEVPIIYWLYYFFRMVTQDTCQL